MIQECGKCFGTGLVKNNTKVCGSCSGKGVIELEESETVRTLTGNEEEFVQKVIDDVYKPLVKGEEFTAKPNLTPKKGFFARLLGK